MIVGYRDNCKICAHYLGEQACRAFPAGIPRRLWSGENPHRESYPGDQGYRFQGRPLDTFFTDDDDLLESAPQPTDRHAA